MTDLTREQIEEYRRKHLLPRGIGCIMPLYYGPDLLEACCARKSWEAKRARSEL